MGIQLGGGLEQMRRLLEIDRAVHVLPASLGHLYQGLGDVAAQRQRSGVGGINVHSGRLLLGQASQEGGFADAQLAVKEKAALLLGGQEAVHCLAQPLPADEAVCPS